MDRPFFPNQPRQSLEIEKRLRELVKDCPEAQRYASYQLISEAHPSFTETSFEVAADRVTAHQLRSAIAFPRPVPLVILSHIVFGYREWLKHKYELPDFVSVETGDVVVDCGGFVGGFSLSASERASHVHVFEPESANFACCRQNHSDRSNVTVIQKGLFNETKDASLNISASAVEHSLLATDDGSDVGRQVIQLITLEEYCRQGDVPQIDFLKIEAEGVELEVFDGLSGLRPRKIAIDVSPERDGESPAAEFCEILKPLGYEIRQRSNVLFARFPAAA